MPRARVPHENWTRGEVSDRLGGRVGLEQYANAASVLANYTVLEAGSITRRPGTHVITETKSNAQAWLVRFEFSVDDAYILEFTEGFIRFYKDTALIGGVTPIVVTAPYLAADIPELKFAQSADVLFIFSRYYQTRQLERYSDTVWQLRTLASTTTGVPTPSFEYGTRPVSGATLTATATTGSTTFTAGAAMFLASDDSPVSSLLGRELIVFAGDNIGGRATITAVTDSTHVTATISQAFANTNAIDETDWKISASPLTGCTPNAKDPLNKEITLTLDAAGWRSSDVGKFVQINGGIVELGGLVSDTVINAIIRSLLNATTKAEPGAWSLEEASWSSYNGYPGAGVFHEDRLWAGGSLAQPQTIWGSKTGDYPNFAVGVADDDAVQFTLAEAQVNAVRWLASSRALIVGTAGGETVIDGGGNAPITPSNVRARQDTPYGSNGISAPLRIGNVTLFITRTGRRLREHVFAFETDSYVAPDLLLLADHMTRGEGHQITQIAYQREPISTVWAIREDGVLLGMTYLRDQNVVAWHRHVTGPTSLDAHGRPIPTRDLFESVAVIPNTTRDREQVWVSVKRVLPGGTRRYVEFFDDNGLYYDTLHVDSAATFDFTITSTSVTPSATTGSSIAFTAGAAIFSAGDIGKEIHNLGGAGRALVVGFFSTTVLIANITQAFPSTDPIPAGSWSLAQFIITGLSHLEGLTVDVVGDGAVFPQKTVASSAITNTLAATQVEVGVPYTSTMRTMRPELTLGGGTTQGQPKRRGEVLVRVNESLGGKVSVDDGVSYEPIFERDSSDPMNGPPVLYSGDRKLYFMGWDEDGYITVVQDRPVPHCVLFLGAKTTVSP